MPPPRKLKAKSGVKPAAPEEDVPPPLARVCPRKYGAAPHGATGWWLKYPARLVAGPNLHRRPNGVQVAVELWKCLPKTPNVYTDQEPALRVGGDQFIDPDSYPTPEYVLPGVAFEVVSRPGWGNRQGFAIYAADPALPAAKELVQLVRAVSGRRATAPIQVLVDALLDDESPVAPAVPPYFRYRLGVLLGHPAGRRRYPRSAR